MFEKKLKLKEYFDCILNEYFCKREENMKIESNIKSLNQIAKEFGVGRTWLNDIWLRKYLITKYGSKEFIKIKNDLWPSDVKGAQEKKVAFFKTISSIMKKYPNNVHKIDGINQMVKKMGITKKTLTNWIKSYLQRYYGQVDAKEIYYKIWGSNTGTEKKIKYEDVKQFVETKGGSLITKKFEFENMKVKPSDRFVIIKCEKNHSWRISILHLLYHDRWCPYCNIYKCQKILQSISEKLFKVKFSIEVSLKKAYGIDQEVVRKRINYLEEEFFFNIKVGMLRFDIYNGEVRFMMQNGKEKSFKIALEYDGIHHDQFPNHFHKEKEQFCLQKARDYVKNEYAEKFKTILIRIKRSEGFDINQLINNPINVQKEILKQFNAKINSLCKIGC